MACALDQLVGICRRNKLVVDEESGWYLDLATRNPDDGATVSHGSRCARAPAMRDGRCL